MMYDYGGWQMEISLTFMMMVYKIISMSINYKDGSPEIAQNPNKFWKLKPHDEAYKVTHTPSLLEVLSYIYSCCGCLLGPWFEFKDYLDFIN
jgi:hypothetical protein